MTFAHPALLLLLLLLPLLVGLKLWGDLRSRNAAARVASARLLPGLLIARGRTKGWLVLFLELGALACFIIALARPQYGFLEEETGSGGRSLIIAIDTSRSMLTDDLKPNRLTRTQLAATDLIKRLRGDRIGLMPFAGSAFMYAPVTPDIDALLESIDSLDTEIIPRGGSNLARPIDLALETFAKADATGQQVLILFSDGENLEGATLEAARRARNKNLTIITIGVGTQAGALIPDPDAPGGFYRDPEGKPVVSRLQRDVLTSIANITDGLYLPLDGDGVNDRRIDLILQKLQRTAMKGKVTRKALDRYRWPLGAGLLLLTGAWVAGIVERHNNRLTPSSGPGAGTTPPPLPGTAVAMTTVSFGLALALAGAPGTALAAAPEKKPREIPVGNPWELYEAGDYEAAQHNFTNRLAPDGVKKSAQGDPVLEFGRGAAAFKNRDFDAAADAFGSAVLSDDLKLRAQAHFNLANSIYQSTATLAKEAKPKTLAKLSFIDGLIKKLENSLENYQQALVLQPDQQDFLANHDTTDELIQKLLEIRKQMAEQQGKGKKKGKSEGEEGEGKGEGEGEGKGKGKGQGEGKGKGGQDEEKEGAGPEKKEEKEAREKSNQDKEGQIGEQGTGEDGEKGEEKGKGKEGEEEGDDGKGGEKDGDGEQGDGEGDIENEINPETGFSAAEAKRQLDRLSDELTERPRIEEGRESRPAKDW